MRLVGFSQYNLLQAFEQRHENNRDAYVMRVHYNLHINIVYLSQSSPVSKTNDAVSHPRPRAITSKYLIKIIFSFLENILFYNFRFCASAFLHFFFMVRPTVCFVFRFLVYSLPLQLELLCFSIFSPFVCNVIATLGKINTMPFIL